MKSIVKLFFLFVVAGSFFFPPACKRESEEVPTVPGPTVHLDIRLPSDSTGGGTLAVRVHYAENGVYRYEQGAVVAVNVIGGISPGELALQSPLTDQGLVYITFLYPGGRDKGVISDGTFDYRGQGCIQALHDVLLFAAGRKANDQGKTINQLLPGTILPHVLIHSFSNGAAAAMTALHLYDRIPEIMGFVGGENPTCDQAINCDLGDRNRDWDPNFDGDGNGIPDDDGKNPFYLGYTAREWRIDYTRLAYDDAYPRNYTDPAGIYGSRTLNGVFFLDGNGNGRIDTTGNNECTDLNGNGRIDPDEDFLLRGFETFFSGLPKIFLSKPLLREILSRAPHGGGPPPLPYAGPEETNTFWLVRETPGHYESLIQKYPQFKVLLYFACSDHMQQVDDHPHLQQAYDTYRGLNLWCRLNPDLAYVSEYQNRYASTAVDNPANILVAPGQMKPFGEPYPADGGHFTVASVLELADRIVFNDFSVNLDKVLIK